MMLSRRMPRPTPVSTCTPSSSGPRCRMTSHIACTVERVSSEGKDDERLESANPAIPHIETIPNPLSLIPNPWSLSRIPIANLESESDFRATGCEPRTREPANRGSSHIDLMHGSGQLGHALDRCAVGEDDQRLVRPEGQRGSIDQDGFARG